MSLLPVLLYYYLALTNKVDVFQLFQFARGSICIVLGSDK